MNKELEQAQRELRVVQEMLYLVLQEVGEPVYVPVETLKSGIQNDKMIDVVMTADESAWVFSIKEVPDDVE